ncbi:MAG: SH3 domain-containing protein [Roseburia sp.]|nr:SH3 domain-containing protein [Roseburia sp.]
MSGIMDMFFRLPFGVRVAMLLLMIVVLWAIFRKVICWVLSLIPYVLIKIFRIFYLLIEMPIAALHKKWGSCFYKIDNILSLVGEKTDTVLHCWYMAWHYPKKFHLGISLLVYAVCVALIVVPSFMKTDSNLKFGENAYRHCETRFIKWLEEREWYNPTMQAAMNQEEQIESGSAETDSFDVILVVSGVSSSLLVRDIPSTENCIILDRLQNDDTVIWKGQLVFSEADNSHIEPWVKVVTANGVEGWCRLFYLHPDDYMEQEFYVIL